MLSVLLAGCGKKEAPSSAADAVAAAQSAPTAAPEPDPEPAPPAAPARPPSNVDLTVTVTFADGTTKSGHVFRLERSDDFYGEDVWSGETADIKLSADGGSEFKKLAWTEISSITIKPGAFPADVNCTYDSQYMPWMHECNIKVTATITDTSGKRWTADSGQKWKLVFDDDTAVEFWLKKHYAREQDTKEPSLEEEMTQNPDLFVKLNQRLKEDIRAGLVVSIKVQ